MRKTAKAYVCKAFCVLLMISIFGALCGPALSYARAWNFVASGSIFTNPASLAGNSVWLDGTDPAGTGTPPSSGTAISSWVDKSGNSNTWTQGTAGNKPTYMSSALNSKGCIKFVTANNQYVSISTAFMTTGTAYDLFFVMQPSANSQSFFYSDKGQGGGTPVLGFTSTAFDFIANTSYANGTYTQAFLPSTTYGIEFQYNGSGATTASNYTVTINGGSALTRSGSNSGGSGEATSSIGSDIADNTLAFGGFMCEVAFYNRVLGSTERTSIQNYFSGRWSVL